MLPLLFLLQTASAYTPAGLGTPEPIGAMGGVYAPGVLGLAWTPAAAHPDGIEIAIDLAKVPLGVTYQLDSYEGGPNNSTTNSLAPSAGIVVPIKDFGVGLAVFPLAVRGGEPQPEDGEQRFFTIEGGFQVIEADLVAAWEFDPSWTLGVVLRTGIGSTGGYKAIDTGAIVLGALGGPVTGVELGDPLLEGRQRTALKGSGLGYGLGLRYHGENGLSVDASVRTALKMNMSGTLEMTPSTSLDLALVADVNTVLQLPPAAFLAVTIPAGPVSIVAEVTWIDWTSFSIYTSELSNQRIASEDQVMQDLLDSYGLSTSEYLSAVGDSTTRTGMQSAFAEGLLVIVPITEAWEARAGVWNLGKTVPDGYVHPSNIDYDQINIRGAVAWTPKPWITLGLSADKYFPKARTISTSVYSLEDPGESGVLIPDSNGNYELDLARYGLTTILRF